MLATARSLLLGYLAIASATCVAVATFVLPADPYWLVAGAQADRIRPALESRMRFAKTVQLIERAPRRVLIGSSTVYRGLDPEAIDDALPTFNLGISSLRILEARRYVQHATRFAPVEEVVLGLDFFMFDAARRSEPGFDAALGGLDASIGSVLASTLSWHALRDAWRVSGDAAPKDGIWQRNGHKRTFPRSAESNSALLESAAREYAAMNPDSGPGLAELEALITYCAERSVRLRIFFTPVHISYMNAIALAGRSDDFVRWKAAVIALGERHGQKIVDASLGNPAVVSPLAASSRHYIDPSHYSPLVGAAVLHALGLRVRQDLQQALASEGLLAIGAAPVVKPGNLRP